MKIKTNVRAGCNTGGRCGGSRCGGSTRCGGGGVYLDQPDVYYGC